MKFPLRLKKYELYDSSELPERHFARQQEINRHNHRVINNRMHLMQAVILIVVLLTLLKGILF